MKRHLLSKSIILGFLTTAALFSACKKKEDVNPANSTTNQTPTVTLNPPPSSNTFIVNQVVYSRSGSYSSFSYPALSDLEFINNKAVTTEIEMFISLPNTNPKSGNYKVIAYVNDGDVIPKGKVALKYREYAPNYYTYFSILDTNTTVKVDNQGDSVEVTYENIRVDRTYYTAPSNGTGAPVLNTASVYVSGKYKIKTTPVPITYTASATYTEGSANVLSVDSSSGLYSYFFSNSGFNFSSLRFDFRARLKATKTYSIVSGASSSPQTTNDVYISLVTNGLVNYNPSESGKTLSVTANSDGSFSLSFSNVAATGEDLNLTSYSENISGSATFKQNAPQ